MKIKIELENQNFDLVYGDVKTIKMNNKKGLQLVFNDRVEAIPLIAIREVRIEDESTVY